MATVASNMAARSLFMDAIAAPWTLSMTCLALYEQLISEVLLWVGRPTPAQCAALELTSSLECALGRERALQKQVDSLETQLQRCRAERNTADARCQAVQVEKALIERARADAALQIQSNPGWVLHASMLLLGAALVVRGPQLAAAAQQHRFMMLSATVLIIAAVMTQCRGKDQASLRFAVASLSAFAMTGVMLTDWYYQPAHSTQSLQ